MFPESRRWFDSRQVRCTEHDGTGTPWRVEVAALEDVARHRDELYWHYLKRPGEVRLRFGERRASFSLAIRNEFGLHLWQYVQAQKLWGGPLVEAWRIGGHIYTADESPLPISRLADVSDILAYPDATVAASVYLLLFANGTAQVTAHWINGRIYGAVGDQKGVPVVIFGGDAKLDFTASAHLASDKHPGSFDGSIWQPFADTRIVIRHEPAGDGFGDRCRDRRLCGRAGQGRGEKRDLAGMGLGDAAPGVARYIAPPNWYAKCSEFAPFPIELADGEFEKLGHICAEALLRNSVSGRFTSGGIYRYLDQYRPRLLRTLAGRKRGPEHVPARLSRLGRALL